MTDLKKRKTNEERQTRLVNLCRHLHISVMALHINWLGEEQMIELDVQSSKKGQGRESLQSPLIFISSYRYYAITNTDYTQYYINTCNRGQARPHNACSICLVINSRQLIFQSDRLLRTCNKTYRIIRYCQN